MKTNSLRNTVLTGAALATLCFIAPSRASALTVDLQIGPQGPPPPIVEHRWAPPYRGAVWIAGHYEWVHGHYVWVAGYYTYPPRPGGRWIAPSYVHHDGAYFYRPGRWVY
jgi:hypothetical protein